MHGMELYVRARRGFEKECIVWNCMSGHGEMWKGMELYVRAW